MRCYQETEAPSVAADDDFFDFCNVTPNTDDQSIKETWRFDILDQIQIQIPSWFESLLGDYNLAFAAESESPVSFPLIRCRADAILHHTLATAKERVLLKCLNNVEHGLSQDDIKFRLDSLFWGYQQAICLPHTSATKGSILECPADYALWYGDHCKLETNLVVLLAEQCIDDFEDQPENLSALAAMSMIQHNREKGGRNRETYGIFTDSFTWIFNHLNEKNEFSSLRLNWMDNSEQRGIVFQLSNILDKAIVVKLLSNSEENQQLSFNYQSTWTVLPIEPPQWDESESESESDLDCESDYREVVTEFHTFKMQWFNKFEKSLRKLTAHVKDDSFHAELDNAIKLARVESQMEADDTKSKSKNDKKNKKGKESANLPTLAVTDIRPQDVNPTFNLKWDGKGDQWYLKPEERREVPEYLTKLLLDYKEAMGDAEQNEASTRSRLDAIFLVTLAAKKREISATQGKRDSTQSIALCKSLHWQFEMPIKLPWVYQKELHLISGRMDYSLWYGKPREAETNMLVVEAKRLNGVMGGAPQAATYMAMIAQARRRARRANTDIYGISTDSYEWQFIRLDTKGQVSRLTLFWDEGRQAEIISHIHRIMSFASVLSPVSSAISRQGSVEDGSGMSIGS
ncbi:hypothetical protein BJX99DRAFT_259086 [Aspergillus californicus]